MRTLVARFAVVLSLALPGAGCGGAMLTTHGAILLTGTDNMQAKRIETSVFNQSDTVVMLVDFTWPNPQESGGVHSCEWKWYKGDQLVSDGQPRLIEFTSTPYTLRTARAAATLGSGEFKVETIVDNLVVATGRFTIKP